MLQRPYKTPEEYSRSIKILKYNIEDILKQNQRLKLQQRKQERIKNRKKNQKPTAVQAFIVDKAIKQIYSTLKSKGIPLQSVYRMANPEFKKQILNQSLIRTLQKIKINLQQKDIIKLVTSIDTSCNGKISEQQFEIFIHTYGVGDDNQKTIQLERNAYFKFSSHFRSHNKQAAESLFDKIDEDGSGNINTEELSKYCKSNSVNLDANQIFSIMRYMDPGREGSISKNKFVGSLLLMNKKQQVDNNNEQFEKQMKIFKAKILKNKVNPFEIFDQADYEQTGSVTQQQLQKVLKKYFPKQSPFTLKKWLDLVNYNHDTIIQRSQFLNIITQFFTPQQLQSMRQSSSSTIETKFTYKSTQKLLQEFNNKIEDMGKTRKQVFQVLDTSGDKVISGEEFKVGLKKQFGMESPFVINLLKVFDEDGSGSITMNQFLKILGEDVEFEDVEMNMGVMEMEEELKGKGKKDKKDEAVKSVKEGKKESQKKLKEEKEKKEKIVAKPVEQKKKEDNTKKKPVSEIKELKEEKKEKNGKPIIETKKVNEKDLGNSLKKDESIEKTKIKEKEKSEKEKEQKQKIEKKEKQKEKEKEKEKEKLKLQKEEEQKQTLKQKDKQKKQKEKEKEKQKQQQLEKQKNKEKEKEKERLKQQLLQKQKNKSSQAKKQKSKPIPEPQPEPQPQPYQADDQNYNDQFQPQQPKQPEEPQISYQTLSPHLQRISGLYSLNPQKTLKQFGKYDKRNGYVTQQGFKKTLSTFLTIKNSQQKQQIIDSLFKQACSQQTIVWYNDWLLTVSQENSPAKITDKEWIKSEKPEEEKKKETSLVKKVSKVAVVEPKVDPKQEILIGPKVEDTAFGLIGDIIKKESESKISKKSIEGEDEKRGVNLPDIFLSNEIVGVILNAKPKRSDALLSYILYDQAEFDSFYKLAEKSKLSKQKYKDPSFGHNIASLAKSKASQSNYKDYSWTHVSKVWKTPLAFKGDTCPSDIRQGRLGDCYFLSALACLSEYAFLIERLFEYEDQNNSIFGIWLCIDGVWKLVTLDGYIVTEQMAGKLKSSFSYSDSEEQFWVILLEKAYAKAFGSYDQIVSGAPIEAIKDLSGAPGQIFNHIITICPIDKLWKILQQANKNKFMMTAGTDPRRVGQSKEGKAQHITDKNIVLGHAYSILDLVELNTGERIIQMRNPWGDTEYQSEWSDNGKRWTEELKRTLNYKNAVDGIFWMSFNEYYKQFSTTSINFIRPTYYYKTKIYNQKSNEFIVVVDNFSHGYITFTQKDKRHEVAKSGSNSYPSIDVGEVRMRTDNIFYQFNRQESYPRGLRDTCIEFNPSSSEKLYLFVTLQSPLWCNICYYGKENISFTISPVSNHIDQIIDNITLSSSKQRPSNGNLCMVLVGQFMENYFIFRVRNVSKGKVEYSMTVESIENYELYGNGKEVKDPLKWSLNLGVGETKTVKYKMVRMGEGAGFGGYSELAKAIK